jgi:hypothetical protein
MKREIDDHTTKGHWCLTTRQEMRERGATGTSQLQQVFGPLKRKRNPLGDIGRHYKIQSTLLFIRIVYKDQFCFLDKAKINQSVSKKDDPPMSCMRLSTHRDGFHQKEECNNRKNRENGYFGGGGKLLSRANKEILDVQ